MTLEALEQLLANAAPQRAKLDALRAEVAAIRALDDAAFVRIVRAIKKKLSSPKLADEVAALVHAVSVDRATRAIDPARAEPPPVPWVGSADLDATAHAIEAAIAADPEAQGPYTVLGDYLASIGDPRGEWIAIGHALAKNPTHKAMRAAWTAWMAAHPRALWGAHGHASVYIKDIDWYMGFIRACKVRADYRVDNAALLHALLDEPGPGRFVQRLEVDGAFELLGGLARRPRPTLRTLVADAPREASDGLAAWLPAVGALHTLHLDFPQGADDITFLAPLWRGEGMPALRELALTNCERADELCEALVRSPLAAQLRAVDFSYGTMTAVGAAILVEHRDKLANVERWDFELNYLPPDACTQLRSLSGTQLGDQREDEGHRHGADWE